MAEKDAALRTVHAVIEAVNGGQNTSGLNCMSDNVVIIDDIAPFYRTGKQEAELWLRRLATARDRLHASMNLDAADVRVAGDRAYVVAPGLLKGNLAERVVDVSGTVTATLENRDESWLVTSLVWSSGR